jgi:hypothetical protein
MEGGRVPSRPLVVTAGRVGGKQSWRFHGLSQKSGVQAGGVGSIYQRGKTAEDAGSAGGTFDTIPVGSAPAPAGHITNDNVLYH